jgi:hypothetical protein
MKKLYTLWNAALLTCAFVFAAFSAQAMNGTMSGPTGDHLISFTLNVGANTYKSFNIEATQNKSFSVDWGDGEIWEYVSDSYSYTNYLSHEYAATGDYEVTVTSAPDCELLGINCNYAKVSALNVKQCSTLKAISCSYNALTTLDVTGCTALQMLSVEYNALSSLKFGGNPALSTLSCSFNDLINLDVSECSALEYITCVNNKLTSLDVSANKALQNLFCTHNALYTLNVNGCESLLALDFSNNRLSSVDVSNCPLLYDLEGIGNNMPLSELYAISQTGKSGYFSPQFLIQTVKTENPYGAGENYFGGNYTEYVVYKHFDGYDYNGSGYDEIGAGEVFTVTDGIITFHVAGEYYVYMSNSAINFPNELYVIVKLEVVDDLVLPSIVFDALPNGAVNIAYQHTIFATGSKPITWTIISGSLPAGLNFHDDGTISGTPTEFGNFVITVNAENAAGSVTKTFSLIIKEEAEMQKIVFTWEVTTEDEDSYWKYLEVAT